jgi:hypothetical protein
MKIKPILFSTEMVQANHIGIKNMTRRVIDEKYFDFLEYAFHHKKNLMDWVIENSKYLPGDILWVRETWFSTRFDFKDLLSCGVTSHLRFKADNNFDPRKDCVGRSWRPSIHMPKEAARSFFQVTNVRIERLQDISEEDAKSEGAIKGIFKIGPNTEKKQFQFEHNNHGSYRDGFKYIWCKINGLESWYKNPFVWVYEYIKTTKPTNF